MRLEFMLGTNLLLKPVDLFVDKLYDIAALEADQMVVSRPPERFFISGVILPEPVPGDEAAIDEEVERVVDGSARNVHPPGIHASKELVGVEMSRRAHDLIEKRQPFARRPQLLLGEVLNQDLFCCRIVHEEEFRIGLNINKSFRGIKQKFCKRTNLTAARRPGARSAPNRHSHAERGNEVEMVGAAERE